MSKILYLLYGNLTPQIKNRFDEVSHLILIKVLRNHFQDWIDFETKYSPEFSLGLFITTQFGTQELVVKGPKISKKMKIVNYSIFLPDEIKDLNHYIDLVFEGIGIVLSRYNVPESEIAKMKNECKSELRV